MIPEFLAEVQITYSNPVKSVDRFKVVGSQSVASALREFWPSYDHIEFMYMIMLNRQNQILGYHQVSKGGITGTIIDLRVIYQVALKANASAIIIAHNHPSGNLEPSETDKKVSREVKDAGKILNITLLDHIILTTDGFHSMADDGQL
jgi:DNA repair protein RadC